MSIKNRQEKYSYDQIQYNYNDNTINVKSGT